MSPVAIDPGGAKAASEAGQPAGRAETALKAAGPGGGSPRAG
ncbi:hypothetical protein [Streptomyces sp. NPDC020362]